MSQTDIPLDAARAIAALGRARDLQSFWEAAPGVARSVLGAQAVVLSHLDPADPRRRIDVVEDEEGQRAVPSAAGSGLAARAMASERPVRLGGEAPSATYRKATRQLLGAEPAEGIGWPLARNERGARGALLAFGRSLRVSLGAPLARLLGTFLARLLDASALHDAQRRRELLLGVSSEIVGNHPTIASLRNDLTKNLSPPLPILLLGAKGTGKRHLVRAFHSTEVLSGRELVEFDASRLNEDAANAALFHGLGEQPPLLSQPIVLYIPEVLALTVPLQVRMAQTWAPHMGNPNFELGDSAFVFFASAQDVLHHLKAGRAAPEFFQTFGQRLAELPQLAQRPDDIPLLADHFLLESRGVIGREVRGFTHRAIERLKEVAWADNLAGLREVVFRAASFATTDRLDVSDIEHFLPEEAAAALPQPAYFHASSDPATVLKLLGSTRHKDWKTGMLLLDRAFFPEAVPLLFDRLASPEPIVRIEVVRLLARHGTPEVRTKLVKRLAQEDNRDVLSEAIQNLGEEARQTILIYLRDESPQVRKVSVKALSRLGGNESIPALRSLTDDSSPAVQCEALAALCRLGQSACRSELSDRLSDPRPEVRLAAAEALGSVEGGSASLLDIVRTDPVIDVRIAAVSSLGLGGDRRAVPVLVECLADPFLRFYVIEAIGRLGAKEAAGPLLDLLSRESNSLVRRLAIQALTGIGDPRTVERIAPLVAEPTLAPAVVEALCHLGGPHAEQALASLALPDHPLCLEAVKGLTKIGTERSVEPLLSLLGSVPDFLARFVVSALAAIGAPALGPLVEALADENRRFWAIVALGHLGDARAVVPLMEHYDYSDEVRRSIERIGPSAIEPLVGILPAAQDAIRALFLGFGEPAIPAALSILARPECGRLAEDILAHFGEASAAPILDYVLAESPPPEVLARILRVLGRVRARQGYPLLLKHLAGPRSDLRAAVIDGLSDPTNPMVVRGLLEATEDAAPNIRILALESLARIGSSEAAERIGSLLSEAAPHVRAAAVLCAAALGPEVAKRAVTVAIGDRDDVVSRVGARAGMDLGLFTLESIPKRALRPGIEVRERTKWLRILSQCPGERAGALLVETLYHPMPDEVRAFAQWALSSRDSRLLSHLWPILESEDTGLQEVGREVVGALTLTRLGLSDVVRRYEMASPFRRSWIEYHFRQNGEDAVRLLGALLPRLPRDDARSMVLYLLRSVAAGA